MAPNQTWISPLEIRFTHNTVRNVTTEAAHTLLEAARALAFEKTPTSQISLVEVVEHEGNLYTYGNRRLAILRLLALTEDPSWATVQVIHIRKDPVRWSAMFSSRTKGVEALVMGSGMLVIGYSLNTTTYPIPNLLEPSTHSINMRVSAILDGDEEDVYSTTSVSRFRDKSGALSFRPPPRAPTTVKVADRTDHVQLGAYRIQTQTFATSGLSSDSKLLGTYYPDRFVQIEEVCLVHEENLLRGKLATGGWLNVENVEDKIVFAVPMLHGLYRVLVDNLAIRTGERLNSQELWSLPAGSVFEVVMTKYVPQDNRVRARLLGGVWTTLYDTQCGHAYAKKVNGQEHEMPEQRDTRSRWTQQDVVHEVLEGTTDMFVQTRFGTEDGMKLAKHQWFQDNIPVGAYKVVDLVTTMRQGPELKSKEMRQILGGDYVQVLETRHVREDNRLRGRLLGGGWVSIKDTQTGHLYAEPVPKGVYKIMVEEMTVRNGPNLSSVGRRSVKAGTFVEVVEVKFVWQDKRIRARLPDGGWVSLEDTKTGQRFAEHVQLGTYAVGVEGATIQEGLNPRSKDLKKDVPPGTHVQVVEVKHLVKEKIARGRLHSGGWVTIGVTRRGCQIVDPVPFGKYKVGVEKLPVHQESTDNPVNPSQIRSLTLGDEIDVLETTLVPEISRVQGRIVGGGWVSLLNVDTGAWFADNLAKSKKRSDMHKLRRAGLTMDIEGSAMPMLA